MAKKNKKNQQQEDLLQPEVKPYNIIAAKIRDSFCDYTYEIAKGVGLGDKHGVKGAGIVTDDLLDAFTALNKHIACIDDIFKHAGVEVSNIDLMKNHEFVGLYAVHGFKITGSTENESVILTGSKHLSCGGRSEFDTPKVALDSLSSYKWWNELKEATDNARLEVEKYREGKVIFQEEEKADPKQLTIADDMDEETNIFENSQL